MPLLADIAIDMILHISCEQAAFAAGRAIGQKHTVDLRDIAIRRRIGYAFICEPHGFKLHSSKRDRSTVRCTDNDAAKGDLRRHCADGRNTSNRDAILTEQGGTLVDHDGRQTISIAIKKSKFQQRLKSSNST